MAHSSHNSNNPTNSSNWYSVVVVGVIFLVALGSMVYITCTAGNEEEEIIVGRIKEIKSSSSSSTGDSSTSNKSLKTSTSNKESIIDCENMVPAELQLPRFLGTIPNITATKGDNVSIPCVAENLKGYRMAWLKLHSQTILTIHNHIITKNMRIGLSMDSEKLETPCKNGNVSSTIMMYTLVITSVQEKDEGYYMCQINTDPMKGQWGYLRVEGIPTIPPSPTEVQKHQEEEVIVPLPFSDTHADTQEDNESTNITNSQEEREILE